MPVPETQRFSSNVSNVQRDNDEPDLPLTLHALNVEAVRNRPAPSGLACATLKTGAKDLRAATIKVPPTVQLAWQL